eukprot:GHVN01098571.1.p1 GENE.GHVN01098571.1~~GHVN01098571.1.p1  ORF type:complete len:375 (+),score=180.02 GHVN01098571.1:153-1127(+)
MPRSSPSTSLISGTSITSPTSPTSLASLTSPTSLKRVAGKNQRSKQLVDWGELSVLVVRGGGGVSEESEISEVSEMSEKSEMSGVTDMSDKTGKRSNSKVLVDCFEWWKPECRGTPPTPRTSHRSISVGLNMLVFGGFASSKYSNELFTLSTGTFVWHSVDVSPIAHCLKDPLPVQPPNTGGTGMSSGSRKGHRGGGRNRSQPTSLNSPSSSSPNSLTSSPSTPSSPSTSLKSPPCSQPSLCPRMEASLFFDGKDKIYLGGGSKRFRRNVKDIDFVDFCSDLLVLKVSSSGTDEPPHLTHLSETWGGTELGADATQRKAAKKRR